MAWGSSQYQPKNHVMISEKILRERVRKVSEITKSKEVPIKKYVHEGLEDLASTEIKELSLFGDTNKLRKIYPIYQMGWFLKKQPPYWPGFMQNHITGERPGKCIINFLPIININISDQSCLFIDFGIFNTTNTTT